MTKKNHVVLHNDYNSKIMNKNMLTVKMQNLRNTQNNENVLKTLFLLIVKMLIMYGNDCLNIIFYLSGNAGFVYRNGAKFKMCKKLFIRITYEQPFSKHTHTPC